jgi:hypothetical protein
MFGCLVHRLFFAQKILRDMARMPKQEVQYFCFSSVSCISSLSMKRTPPMFASQEANTPNFASQEANTP